MSCVRKLFKRKFFRTQSSETILVAQQVDNSGPSNAASASTASSCERSDASSVGSDGNVAPTLKPSLHDHPDASSPAVVVAGDTGVPSTAASTSTSLLSGERRRATADLPASSIPTPLPPSPPRQRASRKRPSAGPAIAASIQPPETQGTSDATRRVVSVRAESGLGSEHARAQPEGLSRAVKKECDVTGMEGGHSSKGRSEGPPPDASGRLSSSGTPGSHSKSMSSSAFSPPHKLVNPAATEATVLTALMASPSPGSSAAPSADAVAARPDLGLPTGLQEVTALHPRASLQSQRTASFMREPESADGEPGSGLINSPADIPFLQERTNAQEPSLLLSELPSTTPPGAWGEELDVEAPPNMEASHLGTSSHRPPFLATSPALAGLNHPALEGSISDDTSLPEELFFDCDDSEDTLETQEFSRPMNPTPDGCLRKVLSPAMSPEGTSTPSHCPGEESNERTPPPSYNEEETCSRSKAIMIKEAKRERKVKMNFKEKSLRYVEARVREEQKAEDDGGADEMEEDDEEENGQNEKEVNLPEHLLDVFELTEEYTSNRPKLNSAFQRLNRRQKKLSLLQQQVMQQASELKELTRLIAATEAQISALKDEKKELDVELQKTCERLTDVDEASSKKHEPLMYKKFCAVKAASDAKTLLLSIRSRQKALHFLEAMTYRKFLSLQSSLKVPGSGSATEKDPKVSKRLPSLLPASPKKARKLKDQQSLSSGAMGTAAVFPALPFMFSTASTASIANGSDVGSLFFPTQESQQQQPPQGQQTPSRSSSLCSTVLLFEEFRETEV